MNFSINLSLLIIALPVTALLLFYTRRMAEKLKLVDVPDYRKIHRTPIPLNGGVVLFMVAVILMMFSQDINDFAIHLMIATAIIFAIGLIDDIFGVSAFWRFFVQISASLVLIHFTDVKLNTFGNLLFPEWDLCLGGMSAAVTVFGVVGVINAINMSDGIDGLAAMTFFMPVLALVLLADANGFSIWLLYFLMSLLVFVIFNQSKQYKVFLGDSGSMFLGYILAWLLVLYSQNSRYQIATIYPVTALYLVGLPIYDTIYVMLRRILRGISPFQPDKTHLHHLFLAYGCSQTKTLFYILALQLIMIVSGVILLFYKVGEYIQFYIFVIASTVYYRMMRYFWLVEEKKS